VLRLGVIGGGFGAVALAPAFDGIEGCDVRVLERPRGRWREFIADPELDAVAIAVPPEAQYELTRAAIDRGLHVFVEKPLTTTLGQASDLNERALQHGVANTVDFMFCEIAQWRAARRLLVEQTLGSCRHVAVTWTWLSDDVRLSRSTWRTDPARGGGALAHYFCHGLHYLEWFLGNVESLTSSFRYSPESINGGEVGVDLLLRFRTATGSVHVSCDARHSVSHRLVFQCDRGTIVLENHDAVVKGFRVVVHSEQGMREVDVANDPIDPRQDERVGAVQGVAERFVRACRGEGDGRPTFADAVRVHALMDAARSTRSRLEA
jgi:dTDP-3,4-didehydro-2,6-dideoxy-alpha-D-glucose 3-reductase